LITFFQWNRCTIQIPISTTNATKLHYFITGFKGENIASGVETVSDKSSQIQLTREQTSKLGLGSNDIKVFAVSESILRPDIYRSSFLAVDSKISELPTIPLVELEPIDQNDESWNWIFIILGVGIVGSIIFVRKSRKKSQLKV